MIPPIAALDYDGPLARNVRAALDAKTKPPGSLGRLEDLALQIALVQDTAQPRLGHCEALVFAADHGIAAEGVSPYPQTVTGQMVQNFLGGGAAIAVLARSLGAGLRVIDAGVLQAPPPHPQLLSRRVTAGSRSFLHGPALSADEVARAIEWGIAVIDDCPAEVYVLGEMGIGNSSSAAALMAASSGLPIADCVGRGTGLDAAGLAHKTHIVSEALRRQGRAEDPAVLLQRYGGSEIAMLCGAMLGAAARRRLFVVDGFIATAAAAMARRFAPACADYAVWSHVSAEGPHRRWLQHLDVCPLLDLGLRLGEGSGAILAWPLLSAACAILTDMASFASAGVDERPA